MIGLVRSECIKVTSTKYWWIMILIGMALTALATLPILLLGSLAEGEGVPELDFSNPLLMGQLWSGMGSATVIALIIGILSFTGEYRHGTITDTFLTEPRRGRVIAAKAAVNAVLGVALAVMTAVTVVLLALWLLPTDTRPSTGVASEESSWPRCSPTRCTRFWASRSEPSSPNRSPQSCWGFCGSC